MSKAVRPTGQKLSHHHEKSELLDELLNLAPYGVFSVDEQYRFSAANAVTREAFRQFKDLIGRNFSEVMRVKWPDPLVSEIIKQFEHTMQTGDLYVAPDIHERRRDHGNVEHYEWRIGRVKLADGHKTVVCYFRDISEQAAAREALHESEERFRLIVQNAQDYAIFTTDLDGTIATWNVGAERLLGYKAEDVIGISAAFIFTPGDQQAEVGLREIDTALETGRSEEQRWYVRRDGTTFWGSGFLSLLHNDAGEHYGFLRILRDLTVRKRENDERKLLIGELNHRFKNLLAVVQSVSELSIRTTTSQSEFRKAFGSRLTALTTVQDLLCQREWQSADLSELIERTLAPFNDQTRGKLRAHGPPVTLSSSAAVLLSLIVHELTTNAIKYGALAQQSGKISCSWAIDRDGSELHLDWIESGVPLVTPSLTKGFGSHLLGRAVQAQFGGTVKLSFAPDGIQWFLHLPLNAIAPVSLTATRG